MARRAWRSSASRDGSAAGPGRGLPSRRDAALAFASIGFIDQTERNNPLHTVRVPAYCHRKRPNTGRIRMAKNKPSNKPSKSGPSRTSAAKGAQAKSVETPTGNAPDIDIGISGGDRKKIAEGLARFLSDSFTLYLKTHNFHWNVTGSMFNTLHTMFEGQYNEQWMALDET